MAGRCNLRAMGGWSVNDCPKALWLDDGRREGLCLTGTCRGSDAPQCVVPQFDLLDRQLSRMRSQTLTGCDRTSNLEPRLAGSGFWPLPFLGLAALINDRANRKINNGKLNIYP